MHEKKAPTFGYKRPSNRIHAARDLYYEVGESIYAMDDGIVKSVYAFYYDTWAIEIEHSYEYKKGKKLYVRYGEVSKNNIKVKKGDKIAEVGLLIPNIKQPKSDKRGMLHIEMYTGEATGKLTDKTVKYSDMMYAKSSNYSKNRSFQRRKDLIDPLPLLEESYNNSKSKKIIK
ncbi:M23 family metallopeptidase [Tenacibaculum maritimum]|uniref:M23 family metallopeptidase n=1 Tax=Tenacibaculum maritimum TaxID=107401 RepID=UPI001331122B|nr:M23 family metallopeptidase [Tenacibaculum maritimum]